MEQPISPPFDFANIPTPPSVSPPHDGSITYYSHLGTYDPFWKPGHVLPQFPPLIHMADVSWNELVRKLEAIATARMAAASSRVQSYSKTELTWIANYQQASANPHHACTARYWGQAAEEFNERFKCEIPRKALKK